MSQWINAAMRSSFGTLRMLTQAQSPNRHWVIDFVEFVGLVELIKSLRKSLIDKLWMSMVFQKVFIG